MGYLIFWVACGILAAVIASNKGRSGFAWFFIGLITGIFGLILALVIKEDPDEMQKKAIASGGNKKCPYCAEIVKSEAIVCKHCGRDLPHNDLENCYALNTYDETILCLKQKHNVSRDSDLMPHLGITTGQDDRDWNGSWWYKIDGSDETYDTLTDALKAHIASSKNE